MKSKSEEMQSREYRTAYARENTVLWLALQIRELRLQRGWSQKELGNKIGATQEAVSRLENPDYGKWSVSTLLALAEAFDIPLEIKFIGWREMAERYGDVSSQAMRVDSGLKEMGETG